MSSPRIHYDRALRLILEGTAAVTGDEFFRALVRKVAEALETQGAWVTEYLPEENRLRALAFWFDGRYVEGYEYDLEHTPCQPVIEERRLVHVPDRLLELFPNDPDLPGLNAVSYVGAPLLDGDRVLGHLAALDDEPMPFEEGLAPVFEVFAARAQAERRRLQVEARVRSREQQLERLLGTAMDAILVLDEDLRILRANPAAVRLLEAAELEGSELGRCLGREDRRAFDTLLGAVSDEEGAETNIWIPHSLHLRTAGGRSFPVEATLSRFSEDGRGRYTLILRNVDERLAAEERIRVLTREAEWLREEVLGAGGAELIGRGPAMRSVADEIERVAETDATVLVLGETGTGKELVARAIHRRSLRSAGPLVSVNCAALPENLIESELFGHEKGAFTGAVSRRPGRFELADGGTIFLDEIAELPIGLQAKLLRVLQEGEYEPLGGTSTRRVDVRVVAATHRDLEERMAGGEFREDLYYRLSVFPIRLPPLRVRGDDVELLAAVFLERFAKRMGRDAPHLCEHDTRLLRGYHWPGNVRELQNVVERALILANDERLALARAMPQPVEARLWAPPGEGGGAADAPVLTDADVRALEQRNIERALRAAGGKVSGRGGAAELLGIRPSTLGSRMKAFGIGRP